MSPQVAFPRDFLVFSHITRKNLNNPGNVWSFEILTSWFLRGKNSEIHGIWDLKYRKVPSQWMKGLLGEKILSKLYPVTSDLAQGKIDWFWPAVLATIVIKNQLCFTGPCPSQMVCLLWIVSFFCLVDNLTVKKISFKKLLFTTLLNLNR